jgi:hypothetical protein
LSDGARLAITTSYVRDRWGQVVRGPIPPDELVTPELAPSMAHKWLASAAAEGR